MWPRTTAAAAAAAASQKITLPQNYNKKIIIIQLFEKTIIAASRAIYFQSISRIMGEKGARICFSLFLPTLVIKSSLLLMNFNPHNQG